MIACAWMVGEPRKLGLDRELVLYRGDALATSTPPASPAPMRCDATLVRFFGDDADLVDPPTPEPSTEPIADASAPPTGRSPLTRLAIELADRLVAAALDRLFGGGRTKVDRVVRPALVDDANAGAEAS